MLVILGAYAGLFYNIRVTRLSTPLSTDDMNFALRFFFIVITNCLCWLPIICVKLAALAQIDIHKGVYAWLVVLVLPLNSAVNPGLYTFSTSQFHSQLTSAIDLLRRTRRRRQNSDTEALRQSSTTRVWSLFSLPPYLSHLSPPPSYHLGGPFTRTHEEEGEGRDQGREISSKRPERLERFISLSPRDLNNRQGWRDREEETGRWREKDGGMERDSDREGETGRWRDGGTERWREESEGEERRRDSKEEADRWKKGNGETEKWREENLGTERWRDNRDDHKEEIETRGKHKETRKWAKGTTGTPEKYKETLKQERDSMGMVKQNNETHKWNKHSTMYGGEIQESLKYAGGYLVSGRGANETTETPGNHKETLKRNQESHHWNKSSTIYGGEFQESLDYAGGSLVSGRGAGETTEASGNYKQSLKQDSIGMVKQVKQDQKNFITISLGGKFQESLNYAMVGKCQQRRLMRSNSDSSHIGLKNQVIRNSPNSQVQSEIVISSPPSQSLAPFWTEGSKVS